MLRAEYEPILVIVLMEREHDENDEVVVICTYKMELED